VRRVREMEVEQQNKVPVEQGGEIKRSSDQTPDSEVVSEAVRGDLVSTAVKFLQNSRVQGSSQELKRDFLRKKGLSEEEIDKAIAMANVPANNPLQHPRLLPVQYQTSSVGAKIRDFLNIILLIGGFSYSFRYLWKKYICPWLFGPTEKNLSPTEQVLETSRAVLASVEKLQKAVTSLQHSLDSHTERLEKVNQHESDAGHLQGLKSDIQSVKGLLLSSRSFPSNPPVSSPTIPSWQLEDDTDQAEEGIEPDLVVDTTLLTNQDKQSTNVSSASEIEMISADSGEEEGIEED